MREPIYTLTRWHVRAGNEREFVAAWKELGRVLSQLPQRPPDRATLVQSTDDGTLFYSFGPWHSEEEVRDMRDNPRAREALDHLNALCERSEPGVFRAVAESQ